jgi:hypothetical protein
MSISKPTDMNFPLERTESWRSLVLSKVTGHRRLSFPLRAPTRCTTSPTGCPSISRSRRTFARLDRRVGSVGLPDFPRCAPRSHSRSRLGFVIHSTSTLVLHYYIRSILAAFWGGLVFVLALALRVARAAAWGKGFVWERCRFGHRCLAGVFVLDHSPRRTLPTSDASTSWGLVRSNALDPPTLGSVKSTGLSISKLPS